MEKFISVTSKACPLGLANVDTDQVLPARYLKVKRAAGLGRYLFHDLRRKDGELDPNFPLNQPAWQNVKLIVAGRNFGGGSSREAAVYALQDAGIRCVIAPSFGDIFSQNAAKNGLLTVAVSERDADEIAQACSDGLPVTVDLESCRVSCGNQEWGFTIDPSRRERLLNGWDDIALTQNFSADIAAFRARDVAEHCWKYPH